MGYIYNLSTRSCRIQNGGRKNPVVLEERRKKALFFLQKESEKCRNVDNIGNRKRAKGRGKNAVEFRFLSEIAGQREIRWHERNTAQLVYGGRQTDTCR